MKYKHLLYTFILSFQLVFQAACLTSDEGAVDELLDPTTPISQPSLGPALTIVSGNFQTGSPGQLFTDPLQVQMTINGVAQENETINFTISGGTGSGSFSTSSVTTDAAGIAKTFFTANTSGQTFITASANGATATFTLIIVDQSNVSISLASGNSQTDDVGNSLANPFEVQVIDSVTSLAKSNILVRFQVLSGNGRINGSSNTLDVTTNGAGIASVNFDVGTLAGVNTVRASVVSLPAQFVDFTATGTVDPSSPINLAQSTITTSPSALPADGSSTTTLTLTANDLYGNQIPAGGATVVFTPTAGTLIGGVVDNLNGTYTATLRAPTVVGSGSLTVSATVDASPLTSAPATVSLLSGAVNLAQSTVTASPTSITADGAATTLVTVTLKDTLGNQVNAGGETVVISATGGTLIGSVVDQGDGTYTQTLRSSTVAQTSTVSATVGGLAVGNNGNVSFTPGPVDLTTSAITATPGLIAADGFSNSVILVQLRDSFNNPITSSGGTLTIDATSGNWLTAVADNGDGTYQRTLQSTTSPATSVITATLNSSPLTDTANVFITNGSGGPSPSLSRVEITGSDLLPADAVSTTTVQVTVKDTGGQAILGSTVNITPSAGTMLGVVTEIGGGVYQQTLQAPATAAITTVSVTAEGVSLDETPNVSFYGPMHATTSTILATPVFIAPDGVSTSTIFVQAKDVNGVIIPVGGETTLVLATDKGTMLASVTDNGNGLYTQLLQSNTTSGDIATVSATINAVGVSDTATVEFQLPNNLAGQTIDCTNIATHKDTHILVDNGTLIMNTHGPNGSCASDFDFLSVTLQQNAILTHDRTPDATTEYGLELTTDNITIDSTSSINLEGMGYEAPTTNRMFRVQGNQLVQNYIPNTNNATGGSHGGQGGGANGHYPNNTYGSIHEPTTLGAGARYTSTGGHGGGRLKLTVSSGGSLTLHGTINANGAMRTANSVVGGAGGSIWINAETIEGTGAITANGGGGSCTSTSCGGGGGGRIAIYYTTMKDSFALPTNASNNITARGGVGGSAWGSGMAGTVFLKGSTQTYGDLIIDNKDISFVRYAKTDIPTIAPAIPTTMTSTSWTPPSSAGDTYSSSVTPFLNWYIDPHIDQNATPTKSDNTLFKVTSGNGTTLNISSGNMMSIANPLTDQAELVLVLDSFELSGSAELSSTTTRIIAHEGDFKAGDLSATVNVPFPDGLEYSNATTLTIDLNSSTFNPIVVPQVDNLILSNGTINSADDFVVAGFTATNMTITAPKLNATANGILLTDTTANVDEVEAGGVGGLLLVRSDLNVKKLKGNNSITLGGNLSVTDNSTINQEITTTTDEYSLEITAGGMSLDATSVINANAKGYRSPVTNYKSRSFGNVETVESNGGTAGIAGGSHGGRGGYHSASYRPYKTYGSPTNPYSSGASGGRWGTGGPGGGIIRIDLGTNPAIIDGLIDARGTNSAGYRTGGAGGSIYLKAGAVSGSGTITADGGDGSGVVTSCNSNCSGGGGGRIAIHYNSLAGGFSLPTNLMSNVTAFGGPGWGGNVDRNGAAGTIYLKADAQTYGDLIVNNNGLLTRPTVFTKVTMPSVENSATLTSTDLSSPTPLNYNDPDFGFTDHLEGLWVHPNTSENGTASIADDTFFKITSHNSSIVTTAGDMTTIGAAGNQYRIAMILDNLEVSGSERLHTDGLILVKSGDVKSGTANTVNLVGEIGGSGGVEFDGLASGVIDAAGNTINLNNVDASGTLTLKNGTFNLPAVVSGTSIVLDGATANGTTLNLSGDLSIINSGGLNVTTVTVGGNMTVDGSSGSATTANVTGNLLIDNIGSFSVNNLTVGGNLTVDNVSTMTAGNNSNAAANVAVTGNINLVSTSKITSFESDTTDEYYLYISANNVTVDPSSSIRADHTGYVFNRLGGGIGHFRTVGNVDKRGMGNNNNTYSGGSYGGLGGSWSPPTYRPPNVYGNFKEPNYLGTSGSNGGNEGAGDGGGFIRLDVASTLTVEGIISAVGGAPSTGGQGSGNRSGGSGGSIWVNTVNLGGAFSGLPKFSVVGGGGGTGAAGGGGRIAIYYTVGTGAFADDSGFVAHAAAYGGTGTNTNRNGGAGTIYTKRAAQLYGNLIINNNDLVTTYAQTTFLNTTVGNSANLTSTQLTGVNAFDYTYSYSSPIDQLVGFFLNPNKNQNASVAISDDTLFEITGLSQSVATTGGDMTTVANIGDPYKIVLYLDNLEVTNKAHLDFGTHDIWVLSGDVGSADTATFVLDGTLDAGVVEVGDVGYGGAAWTDDDDSAGTITTKCASNFATCL